MAILKGDLKFVASSVLGDVPEGGGAPTGHVIADGVSNEIFDDISELDRAGGNVSMRKVFVAVETDDTDTFLDANVIVAKPPTDPNVSVTLFSTESTFDTRATAQQRVESYLTEASEWPGFLLENHVTGQRVIQIFQRTTERMPNVGETLVLIWHEGLSDERTQFVRVIDTSAVERTYTTTNGNSYQATVVSASISDALRYDFPGTAPNEFFRRDNSATKTRETSVADAAVYCGVVKTTEAVDIGDLAAKVSSVFTQLVPSAQTEIPLLDTSPAGTSQSVVQAGDGTVSYTTAAALNSTTSLSLGNPVTPGTLTIAIVGSSQGSVTLTDTSGQIFDGATAVGTIDYPRGIISLAGVSAPYSGTKTITFKAAAAPIKVADTAQVPITPETRALNYVRTIEPPPAPGSVQVSYRAQGRWYDLRDTGGGVLRGADITFGAGTVSYSSGTISVTLGALPDVGSGLLYSWGSKNTLIDRSTMTVEPTGIEVILEDAPIAPGSILISWNDGSARTASDNGKGVIAGNGGSGGTGTIDYATGVLKFRTPTLPLGGQQYSIAYGTPSEANQGGKNFAAPTRNPDLTLTLNLDATNIRPGTVKLNYSLQGPQTEVDVSGVFSATYTPPPRAYARDDGNGNIIGEQGRVAGTINYATGIVTFQPDGNVVVMKQRNRLRFAGYGV